MNLQSLTGNPRLKTKRRSKNLSKNPKKLKKKANSPTKKLVNASEESRILDVLTINRKKDGSMKRKTNPTKHKRKFRKGKKVVRKTTTRPNLRDIRELELAKEVKKQQAKRAKKKKTKAKYKSKAKALDFKARKKRALRSQYKKALTGERRAARADGWKVEEELELIPTRRKKKKKTTRKKATRKKASRKKASKKKTTRKKTTRKKATRKKVAKKTTRRSSPKVVKRKKRTTKKVVRKKGGKKKTIRKTKKKTTKKAGKKKSSKKKTRRVVRKNPIVRLNPRRKKRVMKRRKMKKRKNPFLGGKMKLEKVMGHNAREMGFLVAGGALTDVVGAVIAKIPVLNQLEAMFERVPQLKGAAGAMTVGTLAAIANVVIERHAKGQAKQLGGEMAKALVAASLVKVGSGFSGTVMSVTGLGNVLYTPLRGSPQLGNVQYTPLRGAPQLGNVKYTPLSGGQAQLGRPNVGPQADFGRSSFTEADYGGGGGYTDHSRFSSADFGVVPEGMGSDSYSLDGDDMGMC